MPCCCVPTCRSNGKRKVPGISFHEVPVDAELREEWLRRIARKDWVPNTTSLYSYVCSKHFLPSDFKEGCKIRVLKKGAVPSLFDVPLECVQPPTKGGPPGAARKRDATESRPDPVASQPPSVVGRAAVHSKGDGSSHHPIQSTAPSIVCCAIPGCCSRAGYTKDVVLHEFPSKSERRELWTLIVRALRPFCRDPADLWVPSEYTRICSKHFTKDDYIQGPRRRYLAPHATPTLCLEACDNQKPGRRGQPRKKLGIKDGSSIVDVNESRSEVESCERHPTGTTTTPVIIRHLLGDSSHSKRDHQDKADVTSIRISNVVSCKYVDALSANIPEPGEDSDPNVRLSSTALAGSCDRQTPDVPLPGSRTVTSVGCQTHVTGLTIEAYEEQIHSLKNECKKLRAELCELRYVGVNTVCDGSVASNTSTNLNTKI